MISSSWPNLFSTLLVICHCRTSWAWISSTSRHIGSSFSPRGSLREQHEKAVQLSSSVMGMDDFFEPPNEDMDEYLGDDEDDEDALSDEDLLAAAGEWDDRVARFCTVQLTGRIGNEPELRYFDDGKVVLSLSLATTRKYHWMERQEKDIKYGDEETDWFGLELWGQTAEFAAKFADKGARVGVVGSLQIDQWADKETGEPRERAKIIVREFELLETKAEAEMRRSNRRGPSFYTDDGDGGSFPSPAGSGSFF